MWKFINCEVRGRGHIKAETPCQDKTISAVRNGVSIIALADGAGSARLSHFGAECVVNSISSFILDDFVNLIKNPDGNKVKLCLLDVIKKNLVNLAEEHKCKLSDLASTLLLVAVFEERFLMVHVGDGIIGYLDGAELKIASLPDNGEFANVTTFVTSNEAPVSMRLFRGEVNNIAGFIIMSDGTAQSLFHKSTKSLAKATIKLMHRTCLLSSEVMKAQLWDTLSSVITKNTQDDCSMAILARPVGLLCEYQELSLTEKCALLDINSSSNNISQRILRYDTVLEALSAPKTLKQLSVCVHLKPKYTKKRLNHLVQSGLILRQGHYYKNS